MAIIFILKCKNKAKEVSSNSAKLRIHLSRFIYFDLVTTSSIGT